MTFTAKKNLVGVMMSVPALVFIIIFIVSPLLMTIILSFTDWDGISGNYKFVGLSNFLFVIKQKHFGRIIFNTFLFVILYVPVLNVLAMLLSVSVFKAGKIFGPVSRTLIFFPNILAHAVIGFTWRMMYSYKGIVNQTLERLKLGPLIQDWLGDPTTVIPAITISIIWWSVGYFMIIYIAGLTTIPIELYEAGDIEGANSNQKFFNITLPLLAPVIKINITLATTTMFIQFALIFTLTGGGPGYYSQTLSLQVYYYAYTSLQQGPGLALAIILGLIAVSIALVEIMLFHKREEAMN